MAFTTGRRYQSSELKQFINEYCSDGHPKNEHEVAVFISRVDISETNIEGFIHYCNDYWKESVEGGAGIFVGMALCNEADNHIQELASRFPPAMIHRWRLCYAQTFAIWNLLKTVGDHNDERISRLVTATENAHEFLKNSSVPHIALRDDLIHTYMMPSVFGGITRMVPMFIYKEFLEKAMTILHSDPKAAYLRIGVTRKYAWLYFQQEGMSRLVEKILVKSLQQAKETLKKSYDIPGAHVLVEYYLATDNFQKAYDASLEILKTSRVFDSRIADTSCECKTRVFLVKSLWGLQHFDLAKTACKHSITHCKRVGEILYVKELKSMLQKIRKRRVYIDYNSKLNVSKEHKFLLWMQGRPAREDLGLKKMTKKTYKRLRNFMLQRICAYCGAQEGELLFCDGCEKVSYCSRKHQKADWKSHKCNCLKIDSFSVAIACET